MWPFKKKKEPTTLTIPVEDKPKECLHQWFDFSWYMESDWHTYQNSPYGEFTIKIIEPYVCCLCKKRENHVLHKTRMYNVTEEVFYKTRKELKDEYKDYLESRAVVEDKIRDMQKNIDREFIQLFCSYFPQKTGSSQSNITLKLDSK